MYEALFFDIDETLLDFKAGQHQALKSTFASQGVTMTPAIKEAYLKKNHALWAAYEAGLIKRENVLGDRFSYIFKTLGITCDGLAMDRIFREALNQEADLLPGTREVLDQLKGKYPMYVVTNGVAETQNKRLLKIDLLDYFDAIFISEDTGYQKPMPAFFDYVFDHLPQLNREKCLIIGDSLSADIQGGLSAGMATCWLNPGGLSQTLPEAPTYEIKELKDLLTILK